MEQPPVRNAWRGPEQEAHQDGVSGSPGRTGLRPASQDQRSPSRCELVRAGPSPGKGLQESCAGILHQPQVPDPSEKGGSQVGPHHACEPTGKHSPTGAPGLKKCGITTWRIWEQNHVTHLYTVTKAGSPVNGGGPGRSQGRETRKSTRYLFHFHFDILELGRRQPGPGGQKPGGSPSYHL